MKNKRISLLIFTAALILSACISQPQTTAPTPTIKTTAVENSPSGDLSAPPIPTEALPTPTAFALAVSLSEVGYDLPLTIRHITETQAVLFFSLDAPVEGTLFYWPEGEQENILEIPLDGTASRQQIILEGLTPGTDYHAVIGLSTDEGAYQPPHFAGQEWGAVNFRTASNELPIRVGILGDSGLGEQVTFDLVEQMASHDLDFVLHTGDLVYLMQQNASPFEAYTLKFYTPFAPLLHQMPVYPSVGNHDVEPAARWKDNMPFYYSVFLSFTNPNFDPADYEARNQWYSVPYGSIQFLMLDTQTFFSEEGRAEQDAWLQERLADENFQYTIPVFHVPPYASGQRPEEYRVVRLSWDAMFQEANVPVVFSGHEHFYERLIANDITYIVTGGGSSVLYNFIDRQPESQFFARETHFVLMEIYDDHIELTAITEEGEILDQVTIPLE